MASTSQESQEHDKAYGSSKVKITILASEWGSSKGDLSIINRELAIQLAKSSSVEITFFVPKCSEEGKKAALSHNVHILEAKQRPCYEALEWLSFLPEQLQVDIIVGHGVKLGRQAQVIRDSHKCKWVQVVHKDQEELGTFKCYPNSVSTGEKKHNDEVELCKRADFVVGVGPKLTEAFCSYLRGYREDETIFDFTPGLFNEFTSVKQVHQERKHRSVFLFGRGDAEDFELKGCDIAGRAVASLPDTHLVFFGTPDGKLEEVKQRFLECGVPANRLKVRGYDKSRESLKQIFCEVDLLLMPSRSEGFGLIGLEALSAGLPLLVGQNSGFGEALSKVPFGLLFVVDSEDPEIWATAIKNVWSKDRQSRLVEAEALRSSYERKYSWTKQSDALLLKMIKLVRACLHVKIDCEVIKGPDAQEMATGMRVKPHETNSLVQGDAAVLPITSNQAEEVPRPSNVGKRKIPSGDEVLRLIAVKYLEDVHLSKPEDYNSYLDYLERVRKVLIVDAHQGSLVVTVAISSLQILEDLWEDYRRGHLNEMAQKFLVTEDVRKEFGLNELEVRLITTIAYEEYRACQDFFSHSAVKHTQFISLMNVFKDSGREDALAKALELSRLEYENNQGNSRTQRETPTPGTQAFSEASLLSREGHRWETYPAGEMDFPLQNIVKVGASNTRGGDMRAIPLCLPNNCKWNSEIRDYIKTGEGRSSLYVVEEALEKLRKVKGPVCVVSIAGQYRKGKSYILSEAFDQADVFPLGHEMLAETMGIWLWIVPEKYQDSRGQEFNVVLLDSEGIDAATSDGRDDNQIFTLTVLLASVLIYNSQGVPTRRDLEGLDFIVKLSQRIQIRSNQGVTTNREEKEFFHKTFPFFLWLLRDVTQSVPRDCKDLKDYFLKEVFKEQDSNLPSSHKSQDAAESILRYFPGFHAFHLPPPTADDEIMRSIHEKKSQLRPQFLTKLEQFKSLLKSTLVPKHSCADGQLVTGEGLAALVTLYVQAINTPGAIPNVQSAWETFVETKCFDATRISLETYDDLMTALLSDKMPCGNDEIRKDHNNALEECQRLFMTESTGISTNTTEKHLRKLKVSLNEKLYEWQATNAQKTQEFCNDLLLQLKQTHLDPVLQRLQGSDGSKLTFDDIIGVYHQIKSDFDEKAVGAKDAIASTFFDFHKELTRETKHCLEILREMKNYDEKAAKEIKMKAYQEQERRRLEEQQSRLQQENRENAVEMEMLVARLVEEKAGVQRQMQSELDEHRVQMQNMMAANMRQAQQEREEFMRENKALEERFLEVQRSNEENMRMIRRMSEVIAQNDRDKKELLVRANAENLPPEELESQLTELNGKQTEEVRALLEGAGEMKDPGRIEGKAEKVYDKDEEELPQLINERKERVANLHQQIADTHQQQAEVEKPSYVKKGLEIVGKLAPVIREVAAMAYPQAKPISLAAGAAAKILSEDCSIM